MGSERPKESRPSRLFETPGLPRKREAVTAKSLHPAIDQLEAFGSYPLDLGPFDPESRGGPRYLCFRHQETGKPRLPPAPNPIRA